MGTWFEPIVMGAPFVPALLSGSLSRRIKHKHRNIESIPHTVSDVCEALDEMLSIQSTHHKEPLGLND